MCYLGPLISYDYFDSSVDILEEDCIFFVIPPLFFVCSALMQAAADNKKVGDFRKKWRLNPLDHCAGLTRDRAAAQWRGLVVPVGNVVATLIVKQCGGCYLRTSLGVISVTKWLLFLYF